MQSLYIVIPAYNEEENIEQVLEGWYPIVEKHRGNGCSRLVVIDDGSRDRTYEILAAYAKKHPLTIALHKENSGHGATHFRRSLKRSGKRRIGMIWLLETGTSGRMDFPGCL